MKSARMLNDWVVNKTLVLMLVVSGMACSDPVEVYDDFDSKAECGDYCAKKYDCANHSPSEPETDACVSACRNSIEDTCGNDNQAAANDKIGECVDKSCADFGLCMTFEAAPECFGFVKQD